jgi:hypothetical protein
MRLKIKKFLIFGSWKKSHFSSSSIPAAHTWNVKMKISLILVWWMMTFSHRFSSSISFQQQKKNFSSFLTIFFHQIFDFFLSLSSIRKEVRDFNLIKRSRVTWYDKIVNDLVFFMFRYESVSVSSDSKLYIIYIESWVGWSTWEARNWFFCIINCQWKLMMKSQISDTTNAS